MSQQTDELIMEHILAGQTAWSALLQALDLKHAVNLPVLEKRLTDAQLFFVENKRSHAAEGISPYLNAVRLLREHDGK